MAVVTHDFLMKNVAEVKPVPYEIKEWGGEVLIERARASKVAIYREQLSSENNKDTAGLGFVIAFCVNEDGTPLFTDADREWLGNQPAGVINSLVEKIVKVNGFGQAELDDAEKNSEKAAS